MKEDIVVIKSYDPPKIPEWFAEKFEMEFPQGILRWNWVTDSWEVWRKRLGYHYLLGHDPLTRWTTLGGERKPLNQELIDHIQKSRKFGIQATIDFLNELDEINERAKEAAITKYAEETTERMFREKDLTSADFGKCVVGFSSSYGYKDLGR